MPTQIEELTKVLKGFIGFHPDMLYHELVVLDKVNSRFNKDSQNQLIVILTLLTQGTLDYRQYSDTLQNLHKAKPETLQKLKASINKYYPDWIGISSPQHVHKPSETVKIYLSIDNSSIHFFANQLFLTCLERGYYDFDFKINNNESTNRRDNVVIYCNKDNFGLYVGLIQELLAECPNIKLNSPHLLGVPYDDKIYCGMDSEDGKTSYTDKLCQLMYSGLQKGKTAEEIAAIIESHKDKQMSLFKTLARQSQGKKQ